MARNLRYRLRMTPLTLIACGLVTGIAAGLTIPIPPWPAVACCLAVTGICLWTVFRGRIFLPTILIAAAVAGWAIPPVPDPAQVVLSPPPCTRILEGRLHTSPLQSQGRTKLLLNLERCSDCLNGAGPWPLSPVEGRIYITVLGQVSDGIQRGALIRILGEARPVSTSRNPGRPAREDPVGTFSLLLPAGDSIAVVERSGWTPLNLFAGLRKDASSFWEEAASPRAARIARALSLGDSGALTASDREVFRRTGTAHLLAVSGLHLGLVTLLVYGIIRRVLLWIPPLIRRIDPGRPAAALAIPLVISFTLLVGARPPVERACVMAVSLLCARALGRRGGPVESISLAAAFLLICDPTLLTTAGFQLSFAAVVGFLLISNHTRANGSLLGPVPGEISRASAMWAKARSTLVTWLRGSTAASAATTPFLLFHFDSASMITIPINTLAVPLVTFLLMPPLLITTSLSWFAPTAARLLAPPLGSAVELLYWALEGVSQWPCTLDSPSPWTIAGTTILCVGALLCLRRLYKAGAGLLAAGVLVIVAGLILAPPRFESDSLTVDFLDVGQGDSTLITFPDGRHWLIDAGGTAASEIGRDHLVPILGGMGVKRLDRLVLTHPDPDHVEGMADVLTRLGANAVWDNGQGLAEGAHESYDRLLATAGEMGAPVRSENLCRRLNIAGVWVEVLHPCHTDSTYDPGLSFNDNSLVIRLEMGTTSVMLMGDLSAEGEQIMLESGTLTPSTYLKLGHHGSSTSSGLEFLKLVSPVAAVVSCGRWNAYGFPHPGVRRNLKAMGADLFRTDTDGAVRLTINQNEARISSEKRRVHPPE